MPFENATLRAALVALGQLLAERKQEFDVAVIGGGALLLAGHITRPTKDLDVVAQVLADRWVLADPLPEPLRVAVEDIADTLGLAKDWLNGGPTDLLTGGLPEGFSERVTIERFDALTVRFASRIDQIFFKVYAAADSWPLKDRHLQDLRQLSPTSDELIAAAKWCQTHDISEGFRDQLLGPVLKELGIEVPGG